MKLIKRVCLLLGFACLCSSALAEQQQSFGDYEVHYSVVPTRFIPQETASAYQITRGENRMLLNISVRRKLKDTSVSETLPQAALIKGQRHDLMRPYALTFREVREQDAIYYLADFLIINEELSRFEIEVTLPESGEKLEMEFVKTLYIDKER